VVGRVIEHALDKLHNGFASLISQIFGDLPLLEPSRVEQGFQLRGLLLVAGWLGLVAEGREE
jgi:hypothetical protein